MLVMKHESGLNPSKPNSIGAVGLIQFMPKTAEGLGTSTAELQSMSGVRQLDYVEKFYKPFAGKMKSYQDMHLVAFYPAAIKFNMRDSELLKVGGSSSIVAKQNKPIDLNNNGSISVGEAKKYFSRHIEREVPKSHLLQFQTRTMKTINWIEAALILGLAALAVYKLVKQH